MVWRKENGVGRGRAGCRDGEKQQHDSVEWKKNKKNRNPEPPPPRENCVVRTSEKPARAERDRNTHTPGPLRSANHGRRDTSQLHTHRPKRSPCNTADAVVDTAVAAAEVAAIIVVIIIVFRTPPPPLTVSISSCATRVCTAETSWWWRANDAATAAPILLLPKQHRRRCRRAK